MKQGSPDPLVSACIAFGLLLALVSFLSATLSPMVAAFAAGLGIGALGVFALLRLPRGESQPD